MGAPLSVDVSFIEDGTVELDAVGGKVASVTFAVDDIIIDVVNVTQLDEPLKVNVEAAVDAELVELFDTVVDLNAAHSIIGFDDVFETEADAIFELIGPDRYDAAVFNAKRDDEEGEFTEETDVEITVTISHADVTVSDSSTFTVVVTNPFDEFTMLVGFSEADQSGNPPFSEADGTRFMTDGETGPTPVDIDVAAFNSVTATLNGAGGASGDQSGGSGGFLCVTADLAAIDALRVWAAEGPSEDEGGWGRFQGGAGGGAGAGGGGGSSHVSDAAVVDDAPDDDAGVADSVGVADGGGGGGENGGVTTAGDGGGGGARGGPGGGSEILGGDGDDGEGDGEGGAGGEGGSLLGGIGESGDDGGQEPGSVTDVDVHDQDVGEGNSDHADITLKFTTDEFSE